MKNIILVDVCQYALESMISLDDVYISVLIVDTKKQRDEILKKYPDRIGRVYYRIIDDNEEFLKMHENDYSLTYDDIDNYRYAQLKVERYMHREILDDGNIQYRYLEALSYWLSIFENEKIDCIISMHTEHGGLYDSIPYEIAKKKNIPVYITDTLYYRIDKTVLSLKYFNKREFVKMGDKMKDSYVQSYLHAPQDSPIIKRGFKHSLIGLFFKYLKSELKLLTKSTRKRFFKENSEYQFWYNLSPKERFFNMKYIMRLRKIYQALATKIDPNEKYVFFALHMEPEAVIMNRAVMSSQIYAIKLISENLPKGWKLYVKEHPGQFDVDNSLYFWFLKNIFCFRSEAFYKTLLDIPNVKFVKLEEPSKEIIKNSQAVSTICGTVSLEAVAQNKPLILFDPKSSVLGKLKNVFKVTQRNDVKNAFAQIKENSVVQYDDLDEILSKYTFETENPELFNQPQKKEFLVDLFNYILKI